MIATTMTTDSASVSSTSWIEPSMKTASSPVTKMLTPCGSVPAARPRSRGCSREISSVLLSRLADHADPEPALPVRAQDRVADVRPERHRRHVGQPRVVVEHQRPERLGRVDRRRRAHHEALVRGGQRPGRAVEGDRRQRVAHVGERQPAARQRHLVDVHPEDPVAAAVDLQVRDAGRRDQPVLDRVLDEVGQVLDRHRVRGHADADHRVGVGVGLDDARLVGVVGQLVHHPPDRVARVRGRDVEVGRVGELDRHPAAARRTSARRWRSTPEMRPIAPSMTPVTSRSIVSGAAPS